MPIAKKNIPEYVRKCWQTYQDATKHLREASELSRKFWVGGKLQWLDQEINQRTAGNMPFLTINRLKTAVDQVENEARNNPPGPEVHPVGGGADRDGADVQEGLIREYEYRTNAQSAYITSLKYACAGNYGVFEMATEWAGERSFEQRIVIKEGEDPDAYFVDPNARARAREDAMWGGKIRALSREKLIEEYGSELKVLNRSMIDRATGWMASAIGWTGNSATVSQWTGGGSSEGPYYVCEFYLVEIEKRELKLYSDNIARLDGEKIPRGVTVQTDTDGEIKRFEPRRKVTKYVVTALDILDETEWLGDTIPYFWVMGPEIYIKGKLYRLSLIDGAMDAQRGLNFAATEAVVTVSSLSKSAYIGAAGQFEVTNAQGINPWDSYNTHRFAYMEYKPVFAVGPAGQVELAPPPQRQGWEAPIARILELCTFFGEQIKAATSVFFDPNVQSVRDVQSGAAIRELQSQTNIGTFNWQDQMHYAIALSYRQAGKIFDYIMAGPRVATIVRADSQAELRAINQEFPALPARGIQAGIDPATGKKGKRNSIAGEFAWRVTAGPNFRTRAEKALENFMEVLKIAPQITQAPGVLPQIVRLVGEGNPEMEHLADTLMPAGGGQDLTPEQLQQQLAVAGAQNQKLQQLVMQMHQAIEAKLPQVEATKWKAFFDGLVKIRIAEITASKDRDNAGGDRLAGQLELLLGQAHELGLQKDQQVHERGLADHAAATASNLSAQEAAQQPTPQETTQ